jgi:Short C-terminal domain
MFGKDWEPARATIVDTHIKSTSGDGMTVNREFAADVVRESGESFRALIQSPTIATNFWDPSVGDVVGVLVDPKSKKVKFDKSDPKLSYKAQQKAKDADFQASLGQPPTAPVASVADRAQVAKKRIEDLKTLKDQGLITDDEFEAKRRQIIAEL